MFINSKIDINIVICSHNGIISSNEEREDQHYMEQHDYILLEAW